MLQIQNNPWLGLASYQVQDADLFFGREKEMSVLCDIIKQNYSTVIYGKSGMGKTSLINAGLIPQLMADGFLPVSIKLEHNGKRSYADQIIGAVVAKLDEQGCEMESVQQLDAILPDECKLWAFFHTNIFWSKDNHRVVPVVFIDQFEEIFTICEDKAVVQDFFTLLNDLFQVLPPDEALRQIEEKGIRIDFNESTNFRLILSLREDFLARLEDYSYNIPVLRKNRVGVSPLNGLQGLDVILKPISGIMNREAALKILEKNRLSVATWRVCSSSPICSPAEKSSTTSIPPMAANTGRAACFIEDSSPTIISRLISRPTTKKNMAISPSFTQCSRDMLNEKSPIVNPISLSQIALNPVMGPKLAAIMAKAVHAIRTMPPADSLWRNVLNMFRISDIRNFLRLCSRLNADVFMVKWVLTGQTYIKLLKFRLFYAKNLDR